MPPYYRFSSVNFKIFNKKESETWHHNYIKVHCTHLLQLRESIGHLFHLEQLRYPVLVRPSAVEFPGRRSFILLILKKKAYIIKLFLYSFSQPTTAFDQNALLIKHLYVQEKSGYLHGNYTNKLLVFLQLLRG